MVLRTSKRVLMGLALMILGVQTTLALPNEGSELVSFAQDLYRQQGINMPRSAFELKVSDPEGRTFLINLVSRQSTLSSDLLQAFQIGGAVSQHAIRPMNQIVVIAEVEFSHHKAMRLWASGDCCEKLYNNRLIPDAFTQSCLRMEK